MNVLLVVAVGLVGAGRLGRALGSWRLGLAAAGALLLLAASAGPAPVHAATLTVNSTGDASDAAPGNGVCETAAGNGVCTLRAALMEANALAGHDTIAFAIGSGVQTIRPASALPPITDPATIDGTTQPGFAGAPLIELDGTGLRSQADGLRITAGSSTARGLVVNGFPAYGIVLAGSGGNVIQGNYVGTDVAGAAARGNAKGGLLVQDSASNLIGGTAAGARNVISGNRGQGEGGLILSGGGATGNTVQGNYIGTDATGNANLGNEGRGVYIGGAPNNLIGGVAPGAGNVISGNHGSGIRIFGGGGSGNMVQGNRIGTNAAGTAPLGNDSSGVGVRSSGNTIGGTEAGAGNLISGNYAPGVIIYDGGTDTTVWGNVITANLHGGVRISSGSGNVIRRNAISGNGGLGIDIGSLAVTPNDAGDADGGPNYGQNFPDLTSATTAGGTAIRGMLNSTANVAFVVEFFASPACDSSGFGEGQTFLGAATVTTDGAGNAAFTANLPAALPAGDGVRFVITATATDPGGNTSEFSRCLPVTAG